MHLENKDFWNEADVIQSQDKTVNPVLYPYERLMLEKLPFAAEAGLRIQVLGCGTGREIPGIIEKFPNASIMASDIAEKMIDKCNENLKSWGLNNSQIDVKASSSEDLDEPSESSHLITTFTSTLTYILPVDNREKFFRNANRILKKDGYVVGVVHHRYGKLTKTLFFLIQLLYTWLPGFTPGDRLGGFFEKKVSTHYFTCNEVKGLLRKTGFNPILVTDLKGLFAMNGKSYNRRKGDNNIVFIGQKK